MEKVLMCMSGGVDSSTAASILVNKGYDVIGINLKLLEDVEDEGVKSCCSLKDVEDARHSAFKLNIPFYVLNMKKQFEDKVINQFIQSYKSGITPNPCIECNRHIKFDEVFYKADQLGIKYVATGHYAKIEKDNETGKYLLKKPADKNKDQTYFLYMLNQKQLERLIFPLCDHIKTDVRKIAKKSNFNNYNKADSQDLCFIQDRNYHEFIREKTGEEEQGDIVDINDNLLGRHKGFSKYTVGQRKGLNISVGYPLYVLEKNMDKNQLIVGNKKERLRKKFTVKNMNYIFVDDSPKEFISKVKIRYSKKEESAVVRRIEENKVEVEFFERQMDITPGQSAVFYIDDNVIGGGIIDKVYL
ncbi:MAG: tRNA 2-thiouridine(34) synthase MnmA [Bacillota bacterium]|nr:tRNA 2-thiouridine(34) synthase MnmA [Bacillota bacterium]